MSTKTELKAFNSGGYDRNLAENGDDRHYWYSIHDMAILLKNVRRAILKYDPNNDLIPEKKYLAIQQNTSGIFLTDPYYSSNFKKYLVDDIERIIGIKADKVQNNQKWQNFMPKLIVIPLISGMHWRTIAIEIDYQKILLKVLFNDPFGNFPNILRQELLPYIRKSCLKLISKQNKINNNPSQIKLGDLKVEFRENEIEQQGPNNQWDCGPITLINVQDYLSHFIKYGDLQKLAFTIGRHGNNDINRENHDSIVTNFRRDHIKNYGEISKSKIEIDRLNKMREVWKNEEHQKKAEIIESFEESQKIEKLDDFYLEIFFTVLENCMQFDPKTNYQESIKYALKFVENEQFEEKNPIIDKNLKNNALLDNNYNFFVDNENFQLKPDETQKIISFVKPNLVINKETDDFIRFIQKQSVYIDKSLLIKEIINAGHIFITAPQRWGKSLNLSMIKAFFQPDGDDPTHYDKNGNYDFSRGNKNAQHFQKLKIAGEKLEIDLNNIMQEYQGKYPVIFLNYKSVQDFKNEEELKENLRSAVSNAYQEHEYLYKKELIYSIKNYKMATPEFNLSDEEIENSQIIGRLETIITNYHINLPTDLKKFQAYFNGEIRAEAPLKDSIIFLCKILYKHYGRKILILVDEFDKPVISVLPSLMENITNSEASKQSKTFMINVAKTTTSLISAVIKGGIVDSQVILTGIFNTLDKSLSSSVNGVAEIPIAVSQNGERVATFFGFDDEDIKTICNLVLKDEIDVDLKQKLQDKLKYWYNGQNVCGKNMYIPSSVMEYFKILTRSRSEIKEELPKFRGFWEQTQTTNLLKPILEAISRDEILILDDYLQILKDIALGNHVDLQYDSDKSLIAVTEALNSHKDSLEMIFSHILIKSGYLTVKNMEKTTYGYPANEVKLMIEKLIMTGWCQKLIFKENWDKFHEIAKNTDFCNSDVSKNIGKAINLIKNTYKNFNEDTFKCILHTIFALSKFNKGVKIAIEAWAGRGYIDIVLYFKREVRVIELKFESDATDDKIKQLMLSAKWQIPEQGYLSQVLKKLSEESKQDISQIKLMPMLLFRCGNNAEWQCQTSNSDELVLSLEEAKLVESFFNQDEIKISLGFKRNKNGERWKHIEGRDSQIEDLRKILLKRQKVEYFEGLIKKIKESEQIDGKIKIEEESVIVKNPRDEKIRKLLHLVKNEEKEQAFQEIQNLITNKGENLTSGDIMEFKCSVKGIGKATKEALCQIIFEINYKKRKLEVSPLANEKKIKKK